MPASEDDLRRECWDAALHAHGTAHIFQKRAVALRRKNDMLSYVGFAVPLVIGALAGTFGQADLWVVVITVGSVITAVQLVVSLWSVIKQWPGELAFASASTTANESLAMRFAGLGANPPSTLKELRTQFEKLQVEDSGRRHMDNDKGVTEKERRRGMRHALRKYQRACAACQQVPTSMETTSTCGVCSQF
ncbi:hypothetical protein I6J39_34070 (plasmid) [Streptomyces californicus]|uniref:Uncharacterized protein n=1 Tax=Streptomyces californicus TaxID=67351 RepID=A0ABX7JEQ3_9ACTN|nr:hypothetical protein I6J39_34070 [Streptomyces californicus]QRV45819.1 hypothetical protein I6J41_33995 [Streptomyces californicus]